MFDLSLAEGWQSWLGDKATFFEKEFKVELHDDLVKQLQGAGVKAEEVESIILSREWQRVSALEVLLLTSHQSSDRHFDHTGNPAAFSRAEVVIHASERSATPCLAHHDRVKEISFNSDSKPAGFFEQSFDFFGDGSLLLLEAGGHTEGHLAALVHTSSNEYVLLAADCCHHSLLLSSLSENKHYKLGKAMYDDLPRAADTLEKLRASNARDEILVVLAHNETEWAHEKWSHGKRNAVVELAGWRKRGLKVPGLNDTVS